MKKLAGFCQKPPFLRIFPIGFSLLCVFVTIIGCKSDRGPIPAETLEKLKVFTKSYCDLVQEHRPYSQKGYREEPVGKNTLGKNSALTGDISREYTGHIEMPDEVDPPAFKVSITPDSTSEYSRIPGGFSKRILIQLTEKRMPKPAWSGAYFFEIADTEPFSMLNERIGLDSIFSSAIRKFKQYVLTGPLIFADNTFNLYRLRKIQDRFKSLKIFPVFASRADDSEIIYVSTEKPEIPNWNEKIFDFTGKVGITDTSGRVILPLEYDFIHTFGALLPGLFEIEQNGHSGLADIQGNIILPPEYDYLLPTGIPEKPLFLKKGNKIGYLNQERQPVFDSANTPDWRPHLVDALPPYTFFGDLDFPQNAWMDCTPNKFYYPEYYLTSPSSLVKLGFAYRVFRLNQGSTLGTVNAESEVKIQTTNTRNPEKTVFFSRLERWAWRPREEFHEATFSVQTISRNLNTITRKEIYRFSGTFWNFTPNLENGLKAVGKDTFEVFFPEFPSAHPDFLARPQYYYFTPNMNGGFRKLHSSLPYPFLDFARLDSGYLNVGILKPLHIHELSKEEQKFTRPPYKNKYFWKRKHCTIAEISEMIALLEKIPSPTPTQKFNLDYLKKYLSGMEGREKGIVDWQLEYFYEPGDDY